jgi:response regulator of citrate/malate metabolism
MKPKTTFKILIVEDSEIFNQLLTNQLKWYAGEIIYSPETEIEISSYRTAEECLDNLDESVDLAFVDYYLDDGKTAMDVIGKIKEVNFDCRIYIVSQAKEVKGHVALLRSIDFLYKDHYSLPRICFITEELIKEKLKIIN